LRSAASAGTAISRNSVKEQRDFFQLPRSSFVCVAGNHYALVPLTSDFVVQDQQTHGGWISAIPLSWGPQDVRPVTLRRHLSMTLPFQNRDKFIGSVSQPFQNSWHLAKSISAAGIMP
jgi:hypothetical protein